MPYSKKQRGAAGAEYRRRMKKGRRRGDSDSRGFGGASMDVVLDFMKGKKKKSKRPEKLKFGSGMVDHQGRPGHKPKGKGKGKGGYGPLHGRPMPMPHMEPNKRPKTASGKPGMKRVTKNTKKKPSSKPRSERALRPYKV